jgi:hypothetical protein
MRWLRTSLCCGLSALAACSAWSSESKLREGGPTPYTRCLAAPAPPAREGRLGALGFSLRDRTLTLKPARWPLRIAAFSGPGFGAAPAGSDLARLRQSGTDVFIVFGGIGESEAAAEASVSALAALGRPMLVLFGGRDRAAARQAILETPTKSIIDITTLARISIGSNTLVPVAGAEQGRYAVADDACGFADRDLAAIEKTLGAPGPNEHRWLLSWQAAAGQAHLPAGAMTDTGLDLGSPNLGRFAARIGALGALFAWPAGRAEHAPAGPVSARLVPRLFGPQLERPEGTRVEPGFLVLELDTEGLHVIQ